MTAGQQLFTFSLEPAGAFRVALHWLTLVPDNDGSLFGYTIRLGGVTEYGSDLPRIVIGAPKAKTIGSDGSYMETGAIYLYNWNNRTERIKIENATGLKINASLWPISYPQWLGGVLDDVNGLDKIITCAPNFQSISSHETLSFHGACYIIDADLRGGSSKLKILSPFSAADEVKNQIYITADKLNIPNLILGQFGFSVRYNKGSDEYLFGAPGVLGWSGATVHYDGVKKIFAKQIPTKNTGSYGGYAVDYGYFDKTKENNYITTIPYGGISSKLGKALIYRRKGKKYFHRAKLSGEQYGEFYGYALLVDDLTGDGLDDILISAPFHSMRGSFDAGAVYMYINQGAENQLLFKQSLLMSPFSKGGRFGTALSKLGDINRDGYNDVAIGAPSSGYHSEGAVAIYFGGPNGLESQPRQILKALPQLVGMNAMFGLGLSNGVYYHSNSFAVGAPNVDRVFYYSSYPVVKINASLEATNAFIPLNATQVEINICVNFLTNFTHLESLVVLFDLKADSSYGRISIGVCIDELITVRLEPKCFVCQPNITSDEASVFVPMLFELSYLLYNNTKSSKDSEFCKECAVVDPSFPNVTRTTIQYLHDCEGNVCVVDLQLRSVDIPNKITLGSAKHLPIKYNISNVGEKALYTKLIISSSLSIPIMRMPAECAKELDVDWRVVCSIAQRQAFAGNTEIELNLDISEIAGAKYVIINAVAYSAGNELTPDNNRVSNRIELITSAEIWITE
ncbi:integrin alpha-PS3-like [Ceratitis capitata]|uniref:integrin alpha-PS3-like n=1 Tax=Ceratitis capitata TaxID=7213 RepID=UPI000A10050A|nr:integrin alpha-PS3-like [Ceratitis capitata]